MADHTEIIGRDDINDLEAILVDHQHRRRRGLHAVHAERRRDLHVGLRAQPARARQALREGEDVAVERETDLPWDTEVDQEKVVLANATANAADGMFGARHRPRRHAVREVGRQGVDPVRRRVAELDAVAVHARRAGRAHLHRADRRDRAVDRRQVLRGDAGDGRGPPRRGVRQVPRHEALGALPDQRAPARCCSTTSSPTRAGT